MEYNFSTLYHTEILEIEGFCITIREIAYGEYESLQKSFFGDVSLSSKKDNLEYQLNQKRVNFAEFATKKNVMAIASWTFNGHDLPTGDAALNVWRQLPMRITAEIEKVIARLNPEDSEAFPEQS